MCKSYPPSKLSQLLYLPRRHFNRNNSEWMYDSENRKFVMTHSAEIAATIAQRLSDGECKTFIDRNLPF